MIVIYFKSKESKDECDRYAFDAEKYAAAYNRVSDALADELLQRAMSVLANLLIDMALSFGRSRQEDKEFLCSLISNLIDQREQRQ
jgi:hypothetical protein